MAAQPANAASSDLILPNSPTDAISSVHFAPRAATAAAANSDFLAATAWDGSASVWEVSGGGVGAGATPLQAMPRALLRREMPLLCSAWSPGGDALLVGGADSEVTLWQIASNQQLTVGKHDSTVRDVFYSAGEGPAPPIISTSWDATVRFWDPRSSGGAAGAAPITTQLKERAYAADTRGVVLVVAQAERHVQVFDLRKPQEAIQTFPSPLKFQSRCVSLFPDCSGFALGSIEGRVAIHSLTDPPPSDPAAPSPAASSSNFCFKSHRQGNEVYSVNGIRFHPRHGTFVTVGGDGVFTYWDKDAKQRLKLNGPFGNCLTCCDWNADGTRLVYGVSYDYSRGAEGEDRNKPNHVAVHSVQDAEIAKRKAG